MWSKTSDFFYFIILTYQSFTNLQYQYFHSKYRVNDNSLIMSHGIKRGKLPPVIWDHFEQDVRKVQRLLNKFISIKTFETYVHIIKRCRFIFYQSRSSFEVSLDPSMVVFYHCSCVAPSLVKIGKPRRTSPGRCRRLAGAGTPIGLCVKEGY